MANSIITNPGSLLGVQSANKASAGLAATQGEISTGKKFSSFADNAAILSISKVLESDIAGLNSVKSSLDTAISTADVALSASTELSDLLIELKEKAVQAADPGLDDKSRLALNDEFTALRDQVTSIVENAEFNGKNIIKSGGDSISALTNADGSNSISVEAQDLSLGGANIALGPTDNITTVTNAENAVAALEDSITNLNAAVSEIASGSNQLEQAKEFADLLQTKTQEGVGNLIDSNLASSAAQLEADKVKQALSIQSLNIANTSSASILQLFSGNK